MVMRLLLGLILVVVSALFGAAWGSQYIFKRAVLPACVYLEMLVDANTANEFMQKCAKAEEAKNELAEWYIHQTGQMFLDFYGLGFVWRRLEQPQNRFDDALEDTTWRLQLSKLANTWKEKYKERSKGENA